MEEIMSEEKRYLFEMARRAPTVGTGEGMPKPQVIALTMSQVAGFLRDGISIFAADPEAWEAVEQFRTKA